jgi:hypothetical protein
MVRRSLMTSREAPTIARCDLTVRRDRFLATSCRERSISVCPLYPHFVSLIAEPISQNRTVENAIPRKYPSCVVFGKGQSMQCDGGSCAAGRGIRSCHSGIGRSCYHHGRRACPAHHSVSNQSFLEPNPSSSCSASPFNHSSPPHFRPCRRAQEDVRTFPG